MANNNGYGGSEVKIQFRADSVLYDSAMTQPSENKYYDRKSVQIKPSDIAPLISAFANAEGGTVVIGISDKTRRIEGIQ